MMVDVDDDNVGKVKLIKLRFYSCFSGFFFPGGKNQTKSKENDLESTLQCYKKNHPSIDLYLSETTKTIRSLQNALACGQLATEEALSKAESLSQSFSAIPDEPRDAIAVDFLIDVAVPKLLTEVIRSLYQKYPNVFSSDRQVGQANLAGIFYESGFTILIEMRYGVRDAVKIARFLMCGKPCNCYSTREFVVLTDPFCRKS